MRTARNSGYISRLKIGGRGGEEKELSYLLLVGNTLIKASYLYREM